MIHHKFNIKPIYGLKHPTTKLKESKGFAFIYYGSQDDALYVKKTLDRTAILKDKVRISRTVISENLSKMMFKLKTAGLEEKQIQQNETNFFNDEYLQKEVQRIIKPHFGTSVQVNKITIPHSKKDQKKPLRYARVFFYVSDIKQASNIARRLSPAAPIEGAYDPPTKNEYQTILNCISEFINNDQAFSKYAKSEIYEYIKKNQSNVLHIKGIKNHPKEDPTNLGDEIKEFIQLQNPQWNITNVYAAVYSQMGAWANVTFATYEDTLNAYETFKTIKPKFRDNLIYASLRNVKDLRTVVISVVKQDATEKQIETFLNELTSTSVKTPVNVGEEPVRKYGYFSFNIIEAKKFYRTDTDEIEGVVASDESKVQSSWIELNEVPRRLIIHFFNEFTEEDIKELTRDIRLSKEYEQIFLIGDNKKQLRSNHQKGHVNKEGIYIKHTELKSKKKQRPQKVGERNQQQRPRNNDPNRLRGPTNPGVDFGKFSFKQGGLPKNTGFMQGQQFRGPIPQIGMAGLPGLGGLSMGGVNSLGNLGTGSIPGGLPSSVLGLPAGLNRPFNQPSNLGSQPSMMQQQLGGFKPNLSGPTGLPGSLPVGLPFGGSMPGPLPGPFPSNLGKPPGFGLAQMNQPNSIPLNPQNPRPLQGLPTGFNPQNIQGLQGLQGPPNFQNIQNLQNLQNQQNPQNK